MDVRDLDRIGFVTRHFEDLQGLRLLVPFGMMLLSQGLSPWFERLPLALALLCHMTLFAGGMHLANRSPRYYRNLLGEVEAPTERIFAHWLLVVVLAAAVLAYLLAFGSLTFPRLCSILSGAALLGLWIVREGRWSQSYHLLLGGLVSAVAVLAPDGSRALQRELFFGLSGACLIVAGLLDHWQLVHTLGRRPPPDLDEAGAAVEETR
jgi:hypothetical protein